MNRLIHYFFKLLELLVVILMVAMVIMVFGNVFLRYAFNSGITISDEMSRYCFIWLTSGSSRRLAARSPSAGRTLPRASAASA